MSGTVQATIQTYSAPIVGLSGIVTAVLGKSSLSPAKGAARGMQQILTDAILKLAALIVDIYCGTVCRPVVCPRPSLAW
jgi:hypothetical protein